MCNEIKCAIQSTVDLINIKSEISFVRCLSWVPKQRFKLQSETPLTTALGSALKENIDLYSIFYLDKLETIFNL